MTNPLSCTHVPCAHATVGAHCTGHCARSGCPNNGAACQHHRTTEREAVQ